MPRPVRTVVAALIFACAAPLAAFAQIQTGSILVKAVDQQGAVIPGASVTITSPVLPTPLSGVTDAQGVYRFPALTVGTYQVRVSLQGFKTSVREGLQVLQGQTASIEAQLSVGGMTEETTVKGEPPVVDTKSANVKVNIDKDLLEQTPGGKDIWSILQSKAPGIVFDAPDVGGNQAGLQRAFTSRGTPNAQNTQMLNGVNVNDPSAQGFSMNYYDPSSFENIQVSSGAQDIAVGTAGVFIAIPIFWTIPQQAFAGLAQNMVAQVTPTSSPLAQRANKAFTQAYLFSRAETIYAGTSEVQLDLIAQRILRLPRE